MLAREREVKSLTSEDNIWLAITGLEKYKALDNKRYDKSLKLGLQTVLNNCDKSTVEASAYRTGAQARTRTQE